MTKLKLLFKSAKYSFSLVWRSSGLWIAVYFLLSLVASTLGLASTYALKYLLDSLMASNIVISNIAICISIYIAILLLTQGNAAVQKILDDSIFSKAEHLYDVRLAEKLSALPLSMIDSAQGKNTVDYVRRTRTSAVYLSYRLICIISLFYTFSVAFVSLFAFNAWFSLLFLVLTVPGITMNLIFDEKTDQMIRKQAPDVRKFCYYRWMLTDPWPAKDVRMYDLTEPIKQRYDEVKTEYITENKRLGKKKLNALLFTEIIYRTGEIVFTAFVVWKAIIGDIGIGDVALYVGLALSATSAYERLFYIGTFAYSRTTEYMSRVFDFFAIPKEGADGARELGGFESLEFRDVYFKYPYTDKYVLSGASFTLNKGDKLSLVGINGSGKSTIIKLMLGLYEIDSGEILINGHPMSDYDIRDVRKLFSVLFQSFVQYPLTLRENIALSDSAKLQDDEAIVAALKQSGVYEELQPKLEAGLDSYMTRQFDDKGTELSKGQWQKVALSRAYFKNADIFIFDEPSAALDAEAEDRIFKNFEEISDGKTGIMISHRISAARMSNKIIVLDGGVITECGTHEELVAHDGLYARLYNLQREKYTTEVAGQ